MIYKKKSIKKMLLKKLRSRLVIGSISLSIALIVLGGTIIHGEPWDKTNNPLNLGIGFEFNFDKLPASSQLDTIPWSGSYWASNKGGISARPKSFSVYNNFSYISPSINQLKAMSQRELFELSPAEKFDILTGNYDYPTVASERRRTNPWLGNWEGLCHAWAVASLSFKEPKDITVTNKDGIKLSFSSGDVKGLLTYYTDLTEDTGTRSLGNRCSSDTLKDSLAYRDTNPGAFHVALSNLIGIKKQGFIADIDPSLEVWNHPVFGFESSVIGSSDSVSNGAAQGTVRELTISTRMKYRSENDQSHYGNEGYIKEATYSYILELNSYNDIIGGSWISKTYPDFLWTKQVPVFSEKYKEIELLYKKSVETEFSNSPIASQIPTPTSTTSPLYTPSVEPSTSPTAVPSITPSENSVTTPTTTSPYTSWRRTLKPSWNVF